MSIITNMSVGITAGANTGSGAGAESWISAAIGGRRRESWGCVQIISGAGTGILSLDIAGEGASAMYGNANASATAISGRRGLEVIEKPSPSIASGVENRDRDCGGPACPVCGGGLREQRGKLLCSRCRTICETCCEGGRG